jgi:hypothetical protein
MIDVALQFYDSCVYGQAEGKDQRTVTLVLAMCIADSQRHKVDVTEIGREAAKREECHSRGPRSSSFRASSLCLGG